MKTKNTTSDIIIAVILVVVIIVIGYVCGKTPDSNNIHDTTTELTELADDISYPDIIHSNLVYKVGKDLPYGTYIVRVINADNNSWHYVRGWSSNDKSYDGRYGDNARCILDEFIDGSEDIYIDLRESSGIIEFEFQVYDANDVYLEVISFNK